MGLFNALGIDTQKESEFWLRAERQLGCANQEAKESTLRKRPKIGTRDGCLGQGKR